MQPVGNIRIFVWKSCNAQITKEQNLSCLGEKEVFDGPGASLSSAQSLSICVLHANFSQGGHH